MARRLRARYGAGPLHLLSLLASFGLVGYVVVQARRGPLPLRMLGWFVGAVVAHDLVLYPLHALADRGVGALAHRRGDAPTPAVNYVRLPAAMSGLLLLMFWPLITGHSQRTYHFASGLDTSVYLGRWLGLSGLAFAVSAVLYVVRRAARDRAPSAG
ncbi:MAG: hypothetical protein DLM65_11485 [Candidatus Aeolococcus gillhamiae]|uniref:Uncharacterized protein n=1 Tax=Candidatus Aeolococcus gillhamiae TaxID=3127015 RepID=A0A2W6A6A7_9BACT|nr:MAG: hypothetical protein DLM65_11485 [Candidatus Dormibacter sp. RRmetagenome_bin12]